MHVDPGTAKTTFAILQIIPPQIAEPIIKPLRQPPFCLRGIEVEAEPEESGGNNPAGDDPLDPGGSFDAQIPPPEDSTGG